jgi:hypothetical protein
MKYTACRYARCLIAVVTLGCMSSALLAAEPTIRNLDVRGLRIGGTTTLVIDGDDLGMTPRLLLPFPANQTLKAGGTDKKATFDVVLDGEVVPGYHHLRVVTDGGISLPVVIGVDRLPQVALAPLVSEMPIAFHGAVAGGATVETKFQGKAKQKVLVEVEAQRLGSKLRPIVHLYSPKKLQLSWSWAMPALHGDTRLEAILPEDGTYTIALHDVEYAAAAPSFFRLRIGDWSYVDQVFPPTVAKAQIANVELLGMSAPVQMLVNAPKTPEAFPLSWPKAGVWSGPRPFVTVSAHPEFVELPTKDKLQELPEGPLGVSGKLSVPFEEDRYRVAVTPGKKVRLEVFAERIGSPIDAALVVRNEKGDQLVRAEDSPGSLDPVLEYSVPDKVTSIIVGVVDAQGRGSPRGVYRLVIDPQSASKNEYKLTTPAQRISLPTGGQAVVPVLVERRGYQGKIDLTATMPAGVKFGGTIIPEGADGTLVTLERGEAPFDAVVSPWRGRGVDGSEQIVSHKGNLLERLQPWLATEIAIAPTKEKATDFFVNWRDLPMDAALVPGTKLVLPIKTFRTNEKYATKLTLLTSQVTPILNNQPDPNKSLRQEKPVELPTKATSTTPTKIAVNDGEITVLVPVDLSSPVYDVTVQAELLDPAKKPIAISYTPVRRMAVRLPVVVKLDGPPRIETAYDVKKGAAVKIQGKIERLAGMKSEVALALTGLPAGAKADAITVKAEANDFVVTVTFPPNIAAGEFKGVKLSGSIAPDPKTPAVRVRSKEVDIELVLKAATK